MREMQFVREPVRRKPMSKAEQRREDMRRQVAVAQYMRQGVTRVEAEEMYRGYGIYAPKRRFRR